MGFGYRVLNRCNSSSGFICFRHFRRHLSVTRFDHSNATTDAGPRVCIVGSGPAGFYTAQHLLKYQKSLHVDIFEKLPVPYGLVRFGVAPDHPEVKNAISSFEEVASDGRCRFFGNISVGVDISTRDLIDAYDAVVLAYGAEDDRMLNIKGEDHAGLFSARQFVGWYNGLPIHRDLDPDLDCESVAIVGQGNVALDIARVLLAPLDYLRGTDICEHAFKRLSTSRVQRVYIIGRRGPMEVSFTIKETREIIRLNGTRPILLSQDFMHLKDHLADIPRPKKRLMELLCRTACDDPSPEEERMRALASREWQLLFNRSPVEIVSEDSSRDRLAGIKLEVNDRIEEDGVVKAVGTGKHEMIQCGMVIRSIGYKSIPMEDYIPFDKRLGIIPNIAGRAVTGPGSSEPYKGLYCSGWVKHGPVGVIATTMAQSKETADSIVSDIKSGLIAVKSVSDPSLPIQAKLKQRGVRSVQFSDWRKIDLEEISRGQNAGKPREKITDEQEMLAYALQEKK